MTTKTFDFTGRNGQPLSGRMDLPDGPIRGFALFAHCFTCSKSSLASVRIARGLAARGIGVLRFDFTGLGESGGDFSDTSFSSNVADLVAAAGAMAAAGFGPALLIGHSLGGGAALAAAGSLPGVRAIATIGAPFEPSHVQHVLGPALGTIEIQGAAEVDLDGRRFTFRKAFIDDLADHDQAARIGALARPLLILHSPTDEIVDIENASSIFAAARHPKSFVALDGADHLLTRKEDAEQAAALIAVWAGPHLGAEPATPAHEDEGVVVEEKREGGLRVRVRAGGVAFVADEPVEAGGLGSGPNPYDLLGAALGACTAMTLRLYADRKNLPLTGIHVAVSHARTGDAPSDLFTREIRLDGALDDAQRARLMEIAERCPVHRTLINGARIETLDAGFSPVPRASPPVRFGTLR
jgi:uncharacterized OsmC-like protein/fermentation-respiration switch protein FrsA (DUF1100 family)